MADALVSAVLEQLASILRREIESQVRLVVGVKDEVQMLTTTLRTIRAVLADAETRQVNEEGVRLWLQSLKDATYDIEDVLDEWNTAHLKLHIKDLASEDTIPTKVCSNIPSPFHCFTGAVMRHDIALKVKDINERLNVISKEKDRYGFVPSDPMRGTEDVARLKTASFVDGSRVKGRDSEQSTIVSKLVSEGSQQEKGLQIIALIGMGGIGKTTLAQLAYNDEVVKTHFEKRVWVCVSDPFDHVRVAQAIAKGLEDRANANSLEWESLPQSIHELVVRTKFLLVLDDVWTEDYRKWEELEQCLCNGAKGSRILVTTRSGRVAKMMGSTHMYSLEELSDEECWSVFSELAFFGRNDEDRKNLEIIGRKISQKCKGLPLAAKTLGSLMRLKDTKEDWQRVLDSDVWQLEVIEKHLSPVLLLSYYDLPSPLKRCFSYCAVFPKDCRINRHALIRQWMAQDFLSLGRNMEMEQTGEDYFNNLAARSLFQDFEKDKNGTIIACKMHDIVHDFAQFLTKSECLVTAYDGEEIRGNEWSRERTHHLTVECGNYKRCPTSIYRAKTLRTLLLTFSKIFIPPGDPLGSMKFLRTLDLSGNLFDIPNEVGKLIHLRYLNLSNNTFEDLPETICNLSNLQTLNLNWCAELNELPQGIGSLINLRHLEILDTPIKGLPKGIAKLSSLRTLRRFGVSTSDDSKGAKIGDLRNLNYLRGSLQITGLNNVGDAEEAAKAELKNKSSLKKLMLEFSPEGEEAEKDYQVLQALEPHPELERLKIHFYRGTRLPDWIMMLKNLKRLEITNCKNCESLPPLEKLPYFQSLEVYGCPKLECSQSSPQTSSSSLASSHEMDT